MQGVLFWNISRSPFAVAVGRRCTFAFRRRTFDGTLTVLHEEASPFVKCTTRRATTGVVHGENGKVRLPRSRVRPRMRAASA